MAPSVPVSPGATGMCPQPNQTEITCAVTSRQPRSGGGGDAGALPASAATGRRSRRSRASRRRRGWGRPAHARQIFSRSTTSKTSRRISTPLRAVASSMVSAGWMRKLAA